ncbi:hypothetical protein AK88_03310 [Plasmodium fragile]|uniref:Uncharacterized protein n=1 Tax=Plasmodium fragile TaxID=5857 RepID=A0A0D9QJ80_PLAFR|nr:uncharacterized protein AK88_03310 [Plasmodium fragile]KJP87028.1 hypothetical protein AK88_03310 [Plasmodium fragile]
MNKRGFTEMYDYNDYVYTYMQKIFQMDITRFFFTSNYLENVNRYIIKKNKCINDLTNAQNFVNDFIQKKENVITQKRFCNDVTYSMYFLIFTNLLVTLWHTTLCHLDEANWNQLVSFLMRRLRMKKTVYVLKRSHSFLSRIYRYLTKRALDEKKKKKIIILVKRSRSFKMVQKNVYKINTFCFYVLIFFLPLSVPPFVKDLNTRDYFLHSFLRSINKVVLRYAKEYTGGVSHHSGGSVNSEVSHRSGESHHSEGSVSSDGSINSDGSVNSGGNVHATAPPSQCHRSENMRDVLRKAVSSSQKNICRLKMQSLAQVFRCSFENAPRGSRPESGSNSKHSNNLVDAMRDIHISTRIEQIEKELTAYLRANTHFYHTFFSIIVPMLNALTILMENLEAIVALYVKHKIRKSRKLLFFLGGTHPNDAEKKCGMGRVNNVNNVTSASSLSGGVAGSLTGNLTDDSTGSLPSDFASYMAQQDGQLEQDDLGALYHVKRVKEMLLLGRRKKGESRRKAHMDRANVDRADRAKLNDYYSHILKLCQDERYKEINTRALRCLLYTLYFS